MENRDYFLHKRKAMTQMPEDVTVTDFKKVEKKTENEFYDQKMGTSCNLEDERGSKNFRGRPRYVPRK
jgi:hypothetical protein